MSSINNSNQLQIVLSLQGEIMKMASSGKDETFKINSNDELDIKDYLGDRYIGFKFLRVKDEKTFINRMNFLVTDFGELFIEAEKKGGKRKRSSTGDGSQKKKKSQKIIQYNWTSGHLTGDMWYFVEECCRKASDHLPNVELITREVERPTTGMISDMVSEFLISNEIQCLRNQNCAGCLFDHPSQIQHMDGGCMDVWSDCVDSYLDDALALVTTDKVKKVTCEVMNIINTPYIDNDVDIRLDAIRDGLYKSKITSDYMCLIAESIRH